MAVVSTISVASRLGNIAGPGHIPAAARITSALESFRTRPGAGDFLSATDQRHRAEQAEVAFHALATAISVLTEHPDWLTDEAAANAVERAVRFGLEGFTSARTAPTAEGPAPCAGNPKFIVQSAPDGKHQVVLTDPRFNQRPVEGGADLESFEEAAALRNRLNGEAAAR